MRALLSPIQRCRVSASPLATSLAICATLTLSVASLHAQQPATRLDRSVAPMPGPAPVLRVPTWTHSTLPDGATLIVTRKSDLPLVAFSISFIGGADNFEPADKLGVASFAAQMLSEGTTTRTGEQLSDAQQMLGLQIVASVGGESGTIGFTALADKLEPALALLADMLVHPSFPDSALERVRGRTLVALEQAKVQPNTIADHVFAKVLYDDAHPYGRVVTEQTVRAITRDDVVAFHRAYFRPGRAVISVTGAVDPARVKGIVERALAAWPAGGSPPSFTYPALPAPHARTIYLVDKPKAAQSVFAIGLPGPARDTPDYYALQVMNTILGGLFQSRLNHDIREVKGYSYGVGSNFAYGRGPGRFEAGGDIVTEKTDSALIAFMHHLGGVQGGVPFTPDEIEQGKASLIQSLPRRFSSVNGIGGSLSSLYVQGIPESFFRDYAAHVNAVTAPDLVRVARKYIDLDHLSIVIVGDRAAIEEPLRKTGIAPVVVLDANAKPVIVP